MFSEASDLDCLLSNPERLIPHEDLKLHNVDLHRTFPRVLYADASTGRNPSQIVFHVNVDAESKRAHTDTLLALPFDIESLGGVSPGVRRLMEPDTEENRTLTEAIKGIEDSTYDRFVNSQHLTPESYLEALETDIGTKILEFAQQATDPDLYIDPKVCNMNALEWLSMCVNQYFVPDPVPTSDATVTAVSQVGPEDPHSVDDS